MYFYQEIKFSVTTVIIEEIKLNKVRGRVEVDTNDGDK